MQGIVLVYDITDKDSFLNIRNWMEQINNHADSSVNKILVGNKYDLAQRRVVTHAEGENLAREYKMNFFETSAVNNLNVDQAFMALITEIKFRLESEAPPPRAKGDKGDDKKGKKLKADDKKKKGGSWC